MTSEAPEAPALAYHLVADILGEHYFMLSPPLDGVEVGIVGLDGVMTRWSMSDAQAKLLDLKVRDHPHLRLAQMTRYGRGVEKRS